MRGGFFCEEVLGMRFTYEKKTAWVVLVLICAPFLFLLATHETLWELVLFSLVFLLLLGLFFVRHFLLKGIVVSEEGLTVVRRVFSDLHFPWEKLRWVYHEKARRTGAGLELSLGEEEIPYYVSLDDLRGADELLMELKKRKRAL
jgi:hypothetical protein